MTCKHQRRYRVANGATCMDCGVLLEFTDPVIAAIVDSVHDYTTQLRIAAAMGSAR